MARLLSFFIISLALLSVSILIAVLMHVGSKRKINKGIYNQHVTVTPFHVLTVGFFAAAFVLLYPLVRINMSIDDGMSFVTAIFVSIQSTLQLFTIDADFGIVDYAPFFESEALYYAYTFYASLLHVAAPVFTAGIVLSFFNNVNAYLSFYVFRLPSNIYLISDLNDRSVALAEDIITTSKKRGERCIVAFSDVFDENENEEIYELSMRARRLGCILFAKDITEIRMRPSFGSSISRKVYFISENEDENIKQALTMITACRMPNTSKADPEKQTPSVYDTNKTEFYVFARSAESEVLLNSIDNGNMKVRRIDENRNFVLRTLKDYPIFFDALPPLEGSRNKRLNIVVVGIGMIGTELVKALSWVGQMYGYELNVHIFDGEPNVEQRLAGIAPEMIEMNAANRGGARIEGEPYYVFHYYDGIDVKTNEFLKLVDGIGDVSTVYVTLGDDELNIETAMRMRMQFERAKILRAGHIPKIYAVVYSEIKNDIISSHNGLRTIKGEDYGITLIGSLRSSYTLSAIEQRSIEEAGLACHLKWSGSDESKKSDTNSYNKYEYYRRSSMAEALHAYLRGRIGLIPGLISPEVDEKIYEHEHCRWNAFIRSEGYVYAPEKSDLAKTHKSLRPYMELPDSVRLLDQIVITEIMDD